MSRSNCCFRGCIQISQETGQVVWYSHLFQNFPHFLVIHSDSHLLSQWCHPTISSSVIPFSSHLHPSQHQGLFKWVSSSHQVKYGSFSYSINPSNKYSGLIFFRMDWLDLLALQGTLESSPIPQFKSINSSALSFLYSPTLTSIHDYWKNNCFDYTDLWWQSNVSAFQYAI